MMSDSLSPRAARWLASALLLGWLAFALPRLDDYGATWDCVLGEYAHGEQYLQYIKTGDPIWLEFSRDPDNLVLDSLEGFGIATAPHAQLFDPAESVPPGPRVENREPHLHYENWLYDWYESHPLGGLLSAASCRLLWGRLAWLPSLSAHNLPIVLMVGLLLWVLVAWNARRWGLAAGVGAGLALLLAPRFLCDAFNNLKDAPEAVLYALAVLAWVAALRNQRWPRFVLAGALTGLALAQKSNALFLPFHVLLFFALANGLRWQREEALIRFPLRGLGVAVVSGVLCLLAASPMLWSDPFGHFLIQLDYVLAQGQQSAVNRDFDGPLAFVTTTPPALTVLALLGLLNRRVSVEDRVLLGLGVWLPVARTLLPGAVNFDGVRHFLEFMPFLALLAGLGVDLVLRSLGRLAARWWTAARASAGVLLTGVLFATPAWDCVETWPFGNCYFNVMVGGLRGAQERGWRSSTDYWAASYWQGYEWISEHAEPGAGVYVPVAWHVGDAIAPLRLRADLQLLSSPESPPYGYPDVLYVMYVTNRAFYGPVAWDLEEGSKPAHEIRVQGAPILRIHRVDDPAHVRQLLDAGRSRGDPRASAQRFADWLAGQPANVSKEVLLLLDGAADGNPEALLQLPRWIPDRLHRDAALMLKAPQRLWR